MLKSSSGVRQRNSFCWWRNIFNGDVSSPDGHELCSCRWRYKVQPAGNTRVHFANGNFSGGTLAKCRGVCAELNSIRVSVVQALECDCSCDRLRVIRLALWDWKCMFYYHGRTCTMWQRRRKKFTRTSNFKLESFCLSSQVRIWARKRWTSTRYVA